LGGRGRWSSKFKASLVYKESSRIARATQRNSVSKQKNSLLATCVIQAKEAKNWRPRASLGYSEILSQNTRKLRKEKKSILVSLNNLRLMGDSAIGVLLFYISLPLGLKLKRMTTKTPLGSHNFQIYYTYILV
jgi:hypothetical protein